MTKDLIFLDHPPAWFVTVKFMMRHRMRGAWRLFELLKTRGLFDNKVIRCRIRSGFSIHIPIYRPERRWDRFDLLHYEPELIETFVRGISANSSPVTIVDCGADLGLVSMLIAARRPELVAKVLAFEPSDEGFPLLEKNLSGIPVPCEAFRMGVSDFIGRGELRIPDYDSYQQARYLAPVRSGGFPVITLDSLGLAAKNLLIKIDVEGGELAVIRGARQTIAKAESVIVSTEAHPLVYARTGIDPLEVLRELAALRPFQYTVCETAQTELDLSRPFFEQMRGEFYNYNVVAFSVP